MRPIRETLRAQFSRRELLRLAAALGPAIPALETLLAAYPRTARAADNPIVVENRLPGTDSWTLGRPGFRTADDFAGQIKGYASATSVNVGGSIAFHVTVSPAQQYTVDIYRLGWYGGAGARLMAQLGSRQGTTQPAAETDPATGLITCPWAIGATLTIPATWVSGVHLALLTNAQGYQNYVPFVVRDDARPAALLYQQPVTTYQAYNNYPNDRPADPRAGSGKSLYDHNSGGAVVPASGDTRAVRVSFDRPYADAGAGDLLAGDFRTWWGGRPEIYFLRWLEREGYDVAYATNLDTHAAGGHLLRHRAFLSVGHDEYWSREMYDAAEAARDAGVHLAFFGANDVYWQARFEPSAAGVPDRTLVCYKDARRDPVQGPTTTAQFRQWPVERPEQALLGVMSTAVLAFDRPAPYVVANAGHWAYAGTGLRDGDALADLVGYETDRQVAEAPSPPHRPGTYALLADSPIVDTFTEQPDRHHAAIYQAPSGAWVFAAGTINWAWGLDRPGHADARIQRITANLLDRFIVAPAAPSPSPPASPAAPSPSPPDVPAASLPTFPDVPTDSSPESEAIGQLAALGIIRGYANGLFGPNDTAQRAQMAAFIARAMGWDAEDWGNPFADPGGIDASLWRNVGTLAHYGVAKGYSGQRFGPTDTVTQVQTISFVTRAMVVKGYWQQQPDNPALYPDVAASSGHRGDVATYLSYVPAPLAGTISTTGAWANWSRAASRAWFALAIWRAIEGHAGR